MSQLKTISQSAVIITLSFSVLSACSQVKKTGAATALNFTEKNIVPSILANPDADMVCQMGSSLTPPIMATQDMGADPTRVAVLMYTASGICAENKALDAELRYIRASKMNQLNDAKDARIEQKRWSALAAQRQYTGYQLLENRWEKKYGKKLGDGCPTMKSDLDQTVYLLGLISGLQSMTNDINSGGQVNVPKDIAAVVERGMKCLNNEKFWGAPEATRAVIWTLLPGAGDGKPDPYQTLKSSMQIGEQKGVRLAHALYAVAAQASGDDAKIRDALKMFAAARSETQPVNPKFKLIDAMSANMVNGIADRYWTENTGVRASDEGLSQFWDEQESSTELDELFNDGENK